MRVASILLAFLLMPCLAHGQAQESSTAQDSLQSVEAKAPGPAPGATLPTEKARPVSVPRLEKPPVIDGNLDDEAWKSAAPLKDFYQIQPGDNTPPSGKTIVLVGYDSTHLYVAFHALDDPGQVRATVAKRDNIFNDDYVGMFLDTFNDKRKAYALFFNPLGIQADGILTEGVSEDYSLDIVMQSKGEVTEDGYSVEIAIPFNSLRYEAGKGKLWGVNFYRRIKRFNNELDSWMPVSRDKSGTLNQVGQLTWVEGISAERTIEIIPSLVLSEDGKRVGALPLDTTDTDPALVDRGRFINKPIHADPGLTMKLGLTPGVVLDFAANPDFAQIEADQLVVTANERFPIFFAEKRPFFLEGIDIFQTPLNIVHTRTIVDPDYAVKLSGKTRSNTFGLLLASDNAPGNFSEEERSDPSLLPEIARFIDKNAYIGVMRLKRDIGTESSIGFIGTTYNFLERHNHLAGLDGRIRFDPKSVFSFQLLGTTSSRHFFDADSGTDIYRTGNGLGYYFSYQYAARHLFYLFEGYGRTRDYRADVGFTRRTNTNYESAFVRYTSEPNPEAKLISWSFSNNIETNFDFQGRVQSWEIAPRISFNLQRNTSFAIGIGKSYERVFEEEFGPKRTLSRPGTFIGNDSERSTHKTNITFSGQTEPSKKYSASFLMFYGGGAFDFDLGAGPLFPRASPAALLDPDARLDPGPGKLWNFNASFTYQPTDTLRASFDYTKSKLVRDDTGRTAFDDNIFALRLSYQFNSFTFARARIDYDTLTSSMRGQYLLGWTPSPGTSLYVGYNDLINYNGFSPFTGRREPGFNLNNRTFFIKVSYLFRRSL